MKKVLLFCLLCLSFVSAYSQNNSSLSADMERELLLETKTTLSDVPINEGKHIQSDAEAFITADCCGEEYRFRQLMKSKGGTQQAAEEYVDSVHAEYSKQLIRYGTPLEDVYGVATGKDFDNQDYNRAAAGGWVVAGFFPFAKIGKAFKAGKAFKYSDDVAELVSDGKRLEGKIKLGNDADVIFDAKMSENGNELVLSEIGFYRTQGNDILGAENKSTLATLPFKVLSDVKYLAKEAGYKELTFKYKRALYDNAGNFTGYSKDISQTIKLRD